MVIFKLNFHICAYYGFSIEGCPTLYGFIIQYLHSMLNQFQHITHLNVNH